MGGCNSQVKSPKPPGREDLGQRPPEKFNFGHESKIRMTTQQEAKALPENIPLQTNKRNLRNDNEADKKEIDRRIRQHDASMGYHEVVKTNKSGNRAVIQGLGAGVMIARETYDIQRFLETFHWESEEQIVDVTFGMWESMETLDEPDSEKWIEWKMISLEAICGGARAIVDGSEEIMRGTLSGLEAIPAFGGGARTVREIGLSGAYGNITKALGKASVRVVSSLAGLFFLTKPLLVAFEAYREMDDALIRVGDLVSDILSSANKIWSILLSGVGERVREIERGFDEESQTLSILRREVRGVLNIIVAFDTSMKNDSKYMLVQLTGKTLKKALSTRERFPIKNTPGLDKHLQERWKIQSLMREYQRKAVKRNLEKLRVEFKNFKSLVESNANTNETTKYEVDEKIQFYERREKELVTLLVRLDKEYNKLMETKEVSFWVKAYPRGTFNSANYLDMKIISTIPGIGANETVQIPWNDILNIDADWLPQTPLKAMIKEQRLFALQEMRRGLKERKDVSYPRLRRVFEESMYRMKKSVHKPFQKMKDFGKRFRNLFFAKDFLRILTRIQNKLDIALETAEFKSVLMILDAVASNKKLIEDKLKDIEKNYMCWKKIRHPQLRGIWRENFPDKRSVHVDDLAPTLAQWEHFLKEAEEEGKQAESGKVQVTRGKNPVVTYEARTNGGEDLFKKYTHILIYLDSEKGLSAKGGTTNGMIHYQEANVWFIEESKDLVALMSNYHDEAKKWIHRTQDRIQRNIQDLTENQIELEKNIKTINSLCKQYPEDSEKRLQLESEACIMRSLAIQTSDKIIKEKEKFTWHHDKLNFSVHRQRKRYENSKAAYYAGIRILEEAKNKANKIYEEQFQHSTRKGVSRRASLAILELKNSSTSTKNPSPKEESKTYREIIMSTVEWQIANSYLEEALQDYEIVDWRAIRQYACNWWDQMDFSLERKSFTLPPTSRDPEAYERFLSKLQTEESPLHFANEVFQAYSYYDSIAMDIADAACVKSKILFQRFFLLKTIYDKIMTKPTEDKGDKSKSQRKRGLKIKRRNIKQKLRKIIKKFYSHPDNMNKSEEMKRQEVIEFCLSWDTVTDMYSYQVALHHENEVKENEENKNSDKKSAIQLLEDALVDDFRCTLILQQIVSLEQAIMFAEEYMETINTPKDLDMSQYGLGLQQTKGYLKGKYRRKKNIEKEEKAKKVKIEEKTKQFCHLYEHIGILYAILDTNRANHFLRRGVEVTDSNVCRFNLATNLKQIMLESQISKDPNSTSFQEQKRNTYKEMAHLLREAGDKGHQQSAYRVALYYLYAEKRDGVPFNPELGCKYLRKSKNNALADIVNGITRGGYKSKRDVLDTADRIPQEFDDVKKAKVILSLFWNKFKGIEQKKPSKSRSPPTMPRVRTSLNRRMSSDSRFHVEQTPTEEKSFEKELDFYALTNNKSSAISEDVGDMYLTTARATLVPSKPASIDKKTKPKSRQPPPVPLSAPPIPASHQPMKKDIPRVENEHVRRVITPKKLNQVKTNKDAIVKKVVTVKMLNQWMSIAKSKGALTRNDNREYKSPNVQTLRDFRHEVNVLTDVLKEIHQNAATEDTQDSVTKIAKDITGCLTSWIDNYDAEKFGTMHWTLESKWRGEIAAYGQGGYSWRVMFQLISISQEGRDAKTIQTRDGNTLTSRGKVFPNEQDTLRFMGEMVGKIINDSTERPEELQVYMTIFGNYVFMAICQYYQLLRKRNLGSRFGTYRTKSGSKRLSPKTIKEVFRSFLKMVDWTGDMKRFLYTPLKKNNPKLTPLVFLEASYEDIKWESLDIGF